MSVQIKEQHRGDMMTSGPKSHLLADIVVDTIPGPVSGNNTVHVLDINVICISLLFIKNKSNHVTTSISALPDIRLSSLRMRSRLALFPPTLSISSQRRSWRSTRTWLKESSKAKTVLISFICYRPGLSCVFTNTKHYSPPLLFRGTENLYLI